MTDHADTIRPHGEWSNLHQANIAIARLEAEVKELRDRLDKVDRRSRATAYETDPLNRMG